MNMRLIFLLPAIALILPLHADDGSWMKEEQRPKTSTPPVSRRLATENGWLTDHKEALKKARKEGKWLLMNFTGSDWCPYCIKLEQEVFSQMQFKEYSARNMVLLKVDFPRHKKLSPQQQEQNDRLAVQYSVEGFPTVMVLDSSGNRMGELGYAPGGPGPFLEKLEKLKANP